MRGILATAACALLAAPADAGFRAKHLIFLQMENRAFDHMLGWLTRNNSAINGLRGSESNPLDPSNPASPRVNVSDDADYVDPSPGHGVADTAQQIFGRTWNITNAPELMNGFIANAVNNTGSAWSTHVMRAFKPQAVPVISTLAMEFALLDAYYAGVPGPTFPNRLFSLSGTSWGYGVNDINRTILGWPQKSVFGALDEVNVPYRVYFSEAPTAWLFQDTRNASRWPGTFKFIDSFFTDVAAGDLPPFTMLDPGYFTIPGLYNASDQHPDHDVVWGEELMRSVYQALRASPIWNDSVLIISYDEHGGFYDHVAPPTTGVPSPDGRPCVGCGVPFDFTRLGVRVPTIVVSPWIPKGSLIHTAPAQYMPTPTSQFEGSSIAATVHHALNTNGFLTARDAWAIPLNWIWEANNLTSPRTDCPTTLPTPPAQSPAFLTKTTPLGAAPLSHLQEDWLYMIHGVLGGASNQVHADRLTASKNLNTEAAAGVFIRSAVARAISRDAANAGDSEHATP